MKSIRHTLLLATAVVTAAIAVVPATASASPSTTAAPAVRSMAQLTDMMNRLNNGTPGTAWAVDPATSQVLVTADSSVRGAALARLQQIVADSGGAARLQRTSGTFRPLLSGGDAIYGGQYRCSLGFNVRSGSTYYFLTAGHCGNIASTWYSNSSETTVLGNTAGSSFPNNDFAIVRYTNGSTPPGTVGSQDITSAGNAYVGESVTRRGSTSGVHSGTVQALNATVNYGSEGVVYGMIQTNVCAEPGDSGGPLYSGSTAVGLTSGGSGNCTSGGTTFFQPVTEALSTYGVSVY